MSAIEVKLHSLSLELASLYDMLDGFLLPVDRLEIQDAKDSVKSINKQIHNLLIQMKTSA